MVGSARSELFISHYGAYMGALRTYRVDINIDHPCNLRRQGRGERGAAKGG